MGTNSPERIVALSGEQGETAATAADHSVVSGHFTEEAAIESLAAGRQSAVAVEQHEQDAP